MSQLLYKGRRKNINNNENNLANNNSSNNKKKILFIILVIVLIAIIVFGIYFLLKDDKLAPSKPTDKPDNKVEVEYKNPYSAYRLSGNSLENFDLHFLKTENGQVNKVYSPLSIKYALGMLGEGANGETKDQIFNIIGDYNSKKYFNSQNMSFANALFIKDSYKENIKSSYVNTLQNKYNAEVVYDTFQTPDHLNSWISNKTLNLINNMLGDVSQNAFVLVNALAIDMEWVNKMGDGLVVNYEHTNFSSYVPDIHAAYYHQLAFNDNTFDAKAVGIGAVINRYDIINTLGEANIRKTVGDEYEKWLANGAKDSCFYAGMDTDVNIYLDKYIEEIGKGYNDVQSSDDFEFYVDDNVKVFAKDLKEYNGTTLQYVGIMPKNDSLDNYIENVNAKDINSLINSLKSIKLENFKDGVITEITGYIPMFKFDYELNLIEDLKKIGITNVFDFDKADLSNLGSNKLAINNVIHKADIEFSREGIKAAAATMVSGNGAGGCGFDYLYDVPVEKIDLTFDNPYMFIIRDKNTGEVWFMGTVYEPTLYESFEQNY